MRVVLVDFGERHRHTDKRAALHRIRPPADQSGKRVASRTGKSPDTPDLLRTCDDVTRTENGPVEFNLKAAGLKCSHTETRVDAHVAQLVRQHASSVRARLPA